MAEFDLVITGGMVIDGTRMPRYRADVGVKDGKIAKIGHLKKHRRKARSTPMGSTWYPASSTFIRITTRNYFGIHTAPSQAGTA